MFIELVKKDANFKNVDKVIYCGVWFMIKKFCLIIFSVFLIMSSFSACKKRDVDNTILKQEENSYDVEQFWQKKIRYFCELDVPDFENPENLKPANMLEVCEYYKILSESNIEYNKDIKKYVISAIEVKEIIKQLLGIEDFKYDDDKYYDSENGLYVFENYIGFFDDETYENKEINQIDDQRLEFKITVIDGKTNQKRIERYVLKKDEDNDFYVASKETE